MEHLNEKLCNTAIEGKHLYGGREKKDQPPFNQQGEEHLSSPKNLLIKKSQKGWGKVLREVFLILLTTFDVLL